jgi:hypothetical protein
MPATIRELINADALKTVRAISTDSGYANTVQWAEWAKSTGNPQRFADVNGLYVLLFDEGDQSRESPISKDDFTATITAIVYHAESISSEREMQDRNSSVWADFKKALESDYQRGTHPTSGGALAFWTEVGTPTPIDDPQGQGVSVPITIWYRTARRDPYSQ